MGCGAGYRSLSDSFMSGVPLQKKEFILVHTHTHTHRGLFFILVPHTNWLRRQKRRPILDLISSHSLASIGWCILIEVSTYSLSYLSYSGKLVCSCGHEIEIPSLGLNKCGSIYLAKEREL